MVNNSLAVVETQALSSLLTFEDKLFCLLVMLVTSIQHFGIQLWNHSENTKFHPLLQSNSRNIYFYEQF